MEDFGGNSRRNGFGELDEISYPLDFKDVHE